MYVRSMYAHTCTYIQYKYTGTHIHTRTINMYCIVRIVCMYMLSHALLGSASGVMNNIQPAQCQHLCPPGGSCKHSRMCRCESFLETSIFGLQGSHLASICHYFRLPRSSSVSRSPHLRLYGVVSGRAVLFFFFFPSAGRNYLSPRRVFSMLQAAIQESIKNPAASQISAT